MKTKFWQKTYIFTLILFLVCLNGGIISLAVYTHNTNVSSAEETAVAQRNYIAAAFENDYETVSSGSYADNGILLMHSYANYYQPKGILVKLSNNGFTVHSNFPEDLGVKENSVSHQRVDGVHYIVVSGSRLDCGLDLAVAKDISSVDREFTRLIVIYLITAVVASVILALCLFLILKKLSAPLERLRLATEKVENGDFSVAAPEKGSDEFARLGKSFNSMVATVNKQLSDLEAEAENKQTLIDNMAHELRTPLTTIQGYAEYLEKAPATKEQTIMASKYIVSEAKRLEKISRVLLDSAYTRGNPPEMTSVDVSEVLKQAVKSLEPKAKNQGVVLSCQADTFVMDGNETLLSMLFYNIIENGIKACSEGGAVNAEIKNNAVYITDNGRGIAPEQLEYLTQPFYRTDKSRSRADGGAGLGLALCKQIATLHQMTLGFESKLGEGTTVVLQLGNKTDIT